MDHSTATPDRSAAITSRERVAAALAGEVVDRPAMTLWRHWPVDDQDVTAHARAAIEHHRSLGLDILKLTPSAGYLAEAWGARTAYRGDPTGVRDYLSRPVASPADWAAVADLDPSGTPALRREVDLVRRVRAETGPAVPVLATVFTPISVVRYLSGDELFLAHLRQERGAVLPALRAITRTTITLVQDLLAAGADGIYFSLFPASYGQMSLAEYREIALPFDQQVMAAAESAWLRVAHFHLPFPLLELATQLPANLVSWEHTRGGPSLAEGRALAGRTVLGGIDQRGVLATGRAEDVRRAVAEAADLAPGPRGAGLVLATSCSYPLTTPHGNVLAFADAVRAQTRRTG